MRVMCPNCGTEFETADGKENIPMMPSNYDGDAYCVAKEIHNDNLRKFNMEQVNNVSTKENTFMEMNNVATNNSVVKENNMNGFDMEKLAQMVATQIKADANIAASVPSVNINGGQWAKTSKYYGREICGQMYNPYLDRRFLPKQFLAMMNNFNRNVDQGIKYTYSYMDGIKYMIDECEKLAMLNKRDMIAYDERRRFWGVADCRKIFTDYINNIRSYVERELRELAYYCPNKEFATIRVKGYGILNAQRVETINHRRFSSEIEVSFELCDDETTKKFNYFLSNMIERIAHCYSYKELATLMRSMKLVKLPTRFITNYKYNYQTNMYSKVRTTNYKGFAHSKEFIEGFKKSGAYYTTKALLAHDDENRLNFVFEGRYGQDGINYLRSIIDEPAYVIYAKLKEAIDNSRVDLTKFNR